MNLTLTPCQKNGLLQLQSGGNIFLTGFAGSGKSTLLRAYLSQANADESKETATLASTGSAALILGGRTFHSFFGIGIMQGGVQETVTRALRNSRVRTRLKKLKTLVIDEVSLLSGETISAAEQIARINRNSDEPWGGLRVITVGDFAQLPPISRSGAKDWAFLHPVWQRSGFENVILRTLVRSKDQKFLKILNQVRDGEISQEVVDFLDSRKQVIDNNDLMARFFPHRDTSEKFNRERLAALPGMPQLFPTEYQGNKAKIEDLKRFSPVPETLYLKENALIMLRINDPMGRFVNGSLGIIKEIRPEQLTIKLLEGNGTIRVEKTAFSLLDGDGKEAASATNFPVNLAYATTIHKSQGLTLERMAVDLRNLWEPGQTYVAMSRVRSADGLFIVGWTKDSIRVDPSVREFYRGIM